MDKLFLKVTCDTPFLITGVFQLLGESWRNALIFNSKLITQEREASKGD